MLVPRAMAAPFLLVLLLVVSAGAAAGGDDEAGLPRLELRGIDDPGRGHASDAPEERAFTDAISTGSACGRFARLVAETGNAGQLFRERAAGGGGLTVFCPEDKALAEFEPKFRSLGADDRLAVLLYHGAASCYGRKLFQSFDWVSVNSLATDAATNKSHAITIRDDGDTVWLWPSCVSGAGVRVTKTVSEEAPLAVYVIDAVLLDRSWMAATSQLLRASRPATTSAGCTPASRPGQRFPWSWRASWAAIPGFFFRMH